MFKYTSILLSIFLINSYVHTGSDAQDTFRDDYVYNKDAEGWLKVYTIPATYTDASAKCGCEGAVLASPLNEKLYTALIAAHPMRGHCVCGMLTGILRSPSRCNLCANYTTVEGIELAGLTVTWAAHEPDFQEQKACVIMMSVGTLATTSCDEPYPYVCYKKKIKVNRSCASSDYTLDERTGSCYKFHRIGKSWKQGQMTCLDEGGQLAIINSDTEATVLKELFAQNPGHTIQAHFNYVAAVGFLDWGSNGKWYTLEGKRLSDSGYSVWSSGQPDHTAYNGARPHCGAIFRNGQLDDLWCDAPTQPFICEKAPVIISDSNK